MWCKRGSRVALRALNDPGNLLHEIANLAVDSLGVSLVVMFLAAAYVIPPGILEVSKAAASE